MVVVFVFVVEDSLVFSVVEAGFTIVVLFSVFLSAGAGEVAGATTSVFCSQAPRSAAPAKIQISFFIVLIASVLGQSLNRSAGMLRPYRSGTFAGVCRGRPA